MKVPSFFDRFKNVQVWLVGSHMYGLNTPESDMDFTGISHDDKDYINPFQDDDKTFNNPDNDYTLHTLSKTARLLVKGNFNMIDMVFVKPVKKNEVITEFMDVVRPYVLTQNVAQAYMGYVSNQGERGFMHAKRQNPDRQAQINELGYDAKYVSHLMRGVFSLKHLLDTGEWYDVRESEFSRQLLLEIKNAEYTKAELDVMVKKQMDDLEKLYALKSDKLPSSIALRNAARDFFYGRYNLS